MPMRPAPSFDARQRHRLCGAARRGIRAARKRQRKAKPGAAPPVGQLPELDAAAVDHSVLARDRKAESRSLDAPLHRRRALIEGIENPLAITLRDTRSLVDDIQY